MAMTLITNSADTDSTDLASISFTSSIDSTYKLYIFKFLDINPATQSNFGFQVNVDGESGYNETVTSTYFQAAVRENAGDPNLSYVTTKDQAQGTAFNILASDVGVASDESCAGTLWLFNPSNTTYIKHWQSRVHELNQGGDYSMDIFSAGYFNVTGAIDEIQFKMASDNFDGTIKMYGVG